MANVEKKNTFHNLPLQRTDSVGPLAVALHCAKYTAYLLIEVKPSENIAGTYRKR